MWLKRFQLRNARFECQTLEKKMVCCAQDSFDFLFSHGILLLQQTVHRVIDELLSRQFPKDEADKLLTDVGNNYTLSYLYILGILSRIEMFDINEN